MIHHSMDPKSKYANSPNCSTTTTFTFLGINQIDTYNSLRYIRTNKTNVFQLLIIIRLDTLVKFIVPTNIPSYPMKTYPHQNLLL